MFTVEATLRLAELFTIIGVGGTAIFKMGRAVTRFELIGSQQANEITQLKHGVEKLGEVTTALAVGKQRMDNQDQQISRLTGWYDELRRGEGFVLPLSGR